MGIMKNFFYLVQGAIASEVGRGPVSTQGAEDSVPDHELRFHVGCVGGPCSLDLTIPRESLIDESTALLEEFAAHAKEPRNSDGFGVIEQFRYVGGGQTEQD